MNKERRNMLIASSAYESSRKMKSVGLHTMGRQPTFRECLEAASSKNIWIAKDEDTGKVFSMTIDTGRRQFDFTQ